MEDIHAFPYLYIWKGIKIRSSLGLQHNYYNFIYFKTKLQHDSILPKKKKTNYRTATIFFVLL